MEFMRHFISLGCFDRFVSDVINKKRKQEEDKIKQDDDLKMWIAWCHSGSDQPYSDWKSQYYTGGHPKEKRAGDENLTEDQIIDIVNKTFC